MNRAVLLTALLSLSGCATDTWFRTDTIRELAVTATLAADAYQTADLRNHPTHEGGWVAGLCGSLPSTRCTAEYFGTVALTHWLIARWLPPSIRPYWQYGLIAAEAPVIYSNTRLNK